MMNEQTIYNYLSGKTTVEEEQELLKWLNESSENRKIFFDIKAIWNARYNIVDKEKQDLELTRSLNRLNQRIDNNNQLEKRKKLRSIPLWGSAAAIIAIIISVFFVRSNFYNATPTIVHTNTKADSVDIINLPDGSTIWLRGNSTITYPTEFTAKSREVTLEGEAFFQVKPDSQQPFIVQTETKLIRVLGTSFSVNTDFPGGITETVLLEGSVQLQRIGGETMTTLHPGQQALYSKETKVLEIKEVDASVLTAWRYGLISLSDVSIGTILQCIEDTYDITIKMDTLPFKNRRYNFSFKRSKGAHEALEQLMFMTGGSAEIQKNP